MWIVAGVVLWIAVGVFAVALCNAAAQDPALPPSEADRDYVTAACAAQPAAVAVEGEDLRLDPAPVSA